MAQQLPCPNPTCKHVFSAQEVQSAERLKCPGCGQLFRFRPPGSTAPALGIPEKPALPASSKTPAAASAAKMPMAAAPKAPLAAPVAASRPAVPIAAPVASVVKTAPPRPVDVESLDQPVPLPEPEGNPFAIRAPQVLPEDDAVPLVRSRGVVKNRWTVKHYSILGVALCLAAALAVCAVIFRGSLADIFRGERGDHSGAQGRLFKVRNMSGKEENAFQINAPPRWTADRDLRVGLNALTAWRHGEGDAWFAVAVQDYGQQRPRDAELMKAAIERLESLFGDALELAKKATKAQLGGEDCRALPFKGTLNTVTWYGECYLLTHQGFGYWLFVASSARWGQADDAAHIKDLLDNGKNFALVTERKGWREQPPKMDPFHAQNAPLSMTVPSGAWEKSPAKDVEETGELYLFGRFLREKDNRKNASILVFTADKKSDLKESLREVRSYLEKRLQEEIAQYKYLAAGEGAATTIEPVGDRSGAVTELKLMLNDEPRRYTLLAVVHHEDKAYVIRCECIWEHRQIWQQDFRNALATLKFDSKD
jgi:hypothetical protein